jgi:citrate lyase subunit beta/citryl-CoA lyase
MYAFRPTDDERLEMALAAGTDAVILDLATVAPAERERAREAARAALANLKGDHMQRWVRVGASHDLLAKADIRALVGQDLTGIVLPRATSRNHILYIEALLRDAERAAGVEEGATKIIAAIESAAGLLNAEAIARASRRMVALHFDAHEFLEDLGVRPSTNGHSLQHPRGVIGVVARAVGVLAIDAAFFDVRDDAGLRADTEAALLAGFHGKVVIDAEQVRTVNGIFRPTLEALEYARRIVDAHGESIRQGEASGLLEGRPLDNTRAARARRLIDLATAIEARETQTAI